MKFIVGIDLEGIACVVGEPNTTLTNSKDYTFAAMQATREANAAARALFDCGAEQVIIWDNHGGSLNLLPDQLDPRCDLLVGSGVRPRWCCLDSSFAGVVLVGYHAMDNTTNAILAHTFSSVSFQWMKINGQEVGEMAMDAALVGEMGVPVIFVSSDDAGVEEAKAFLPWAQTVSTKQGYGRNMALCKHPQRVLEEIESGVKEAVAKLDSMKTFSFPSPMELEIRYKRMEDAQSKVNNGGIWRLKDAGDHKDAYSAVCMVERLSEVY